jgi:hypothetical protein
MQRAESPYDGIRAATPHFRRGFVERVEVPALSWVFERRYQGHAEGLPVQPDDVLNPTEWRVTPWALAVASTHPVTEWECLDRAPWESVLGAPVWWLNEDRVGVGPVPAACVIPGVVLRAMPAAVRAPNDWRAAFSNDREANDALALALGDVVRAGAGLTPGTGAGV